MESPHPQGTQGKNTALMASMGALSSLLRLASQEGLLSVSTSWEPGVGSPGSQEVGDLRREPRTERDCLNLPGPREVLWRGRWSICSSA